MGAILIVICAIISGLGAYYAEPYLKDNADAILIMITVFTVFAGFLVAIITILGDPALIPSGSWRVPELRRETFQARLFTHVMLFTLYLIAIALLFVGVVLKKAPDDVVSIITKVWITRAYLFFGIFSFLLTFALPRSLMLFQSARYDAEIERRRKEAGIGAKSPQPDSDCGDDGHNQEL